MIFPMLSHVEQLSRVSWSRSLAVAILEILRPSE